MRHLPGDTIAAISTALGPGAVALVRMSGDRAIEIADRVFRGQRPLADCATHTVHHGRVLDADGHEVDEVLATIMCSPHTYTTEHIIEFGCHGGPVPARRVLAACLEAGARQARRGEFTERAFLGGRIDLVQAEAVADIVSAETPRGLEMALGQLGGGLSGRIAGLRVTLLSMRTEIEAAIDFPEDVDAADALRALTALSQDAHSHVERLLENQEVGAAVRDGVSVALVGKPNVGKSSLMNALLMRDRSIVTSVPGTTRDAIEECLHLDGIPMRLVDTAGWRETSDEAERAGVERARAAARCAALAVFVVDSSLPPDAQDSAVATCLDPRATVVVANKSDLGRGVPASDFTALFDGARAESAPTAPAVLWASALSGDGLEELRSSLAELCLGPAHAECARVSNVRHAEALRAVRCCLHQVDALVRDRAPYELVGSELADATAALSEITGETTPEEVVRHIFDRFCVGK
ncbi:MAG: tRNA uridine-5-carboxymethylaminomethyl(34) synthesis GTPase MnmE [Candidatus Eisenbacteria bacterium]